jgi:hypothetical protein
LLRLASKRAADAVVPVSRLQGSAEHVPFVDAAFDTIVMTWCQRRREDASAGRSKTASGWDAKGRSREGFCWATNSMRSRIASPENVTDWSGRSLTNLLPLPHCSRSSQAPLFPYSM